MGGTYRMHADIYKILIESANRLFGRPRRIWDDNTEANLVKLGCESMK
jgi:hypothetical protein